MSPKFKKQVYGSIAAFVTFFMIDNIKFFFLEDEGRGYLEILRRGTFFWGTVGFLSLVIAFFRYRNQT